MQVTCRHVAGRPPQITQPGKAPDCNAKLHAHFNGRNKAILAVRLKERINASQHYKFWVAASAEGETPLKCGHCIVLHWGALLYCLEVCSFISTCKNLRLLFPSGAAIFCYIL